MAVNTYCIVKCFYVFKNQLICMCIIKDFKPINPFPLQECMKGFYTGIIPWICFLCPPLYCLSSSFVSNFFRSDFVQPYGDFFLLFFCQAFKFYCFTISYDEISYCHCYHLKTSYVLMVVLVSFKKMVHKIILPLTRNLRRA